MVKLQGERSVITRDDSLYPGRIDILGEDAPAALYCIGNADLLAAPCLAAVGARRCTPYGAETARSLAKLSASCGNVLATGGAIGVDSHATRGALEVGGACIEVLGGGLNSPYPSANAAMFQEVIDNDGVIVSECSWEDPAMPYRFRLRNRIVAALCNAMLVVECGLPSGAFAAADEALGLHREVLALPGPITSQASRGCNALIAEAGATMVYDERSFSDALYRNRLSSTALS